MFITFSLLVPVLHCVADGSIFKYELLLCHFKTFGQKCTPLCRTVLCVQGEPMLVIRDGRWAWCRRKDRAQR